MKMFSHSLMSAGRMEQWMEQQQKKRDGPVRCVCKELAMHITVDIEV